MIHLHNFSFSYPATAQSRPQTIINNLSLTINSGEIYALLGENGVGKTSILQGVWAQSFEPSHTSGATLDTTKALLPQNLWSDLPIDPHNINTDYYTLLWNHYTYQQGIESRDESVSHIDAETITNWYVQALSELSPGFEARLEKNLFDFQLSRGQLAADFDSLSPGTQKKILLSIVLATNPSSLLCDELTNHLDKTAIATLATKLTQSTSAILLVDHSVDFLNSLVRNWIYIPNNQDRTALVIKDMSYTDCISHIDAIHTNQQNTLRTLKNTEKKLNAARELQRRRVEVYSVNVGAAVKHLSRRIESEITNNSLHTMIDQSKHADFTHAITTIKSKKIKKDRFIAAHELVYHIGSNKTQRIEEFKVYNGDRLRITGHNGSGKSTLISLISQAIRDEDYTCDPQYSSGEITINPTITKVSYFEFNQVKTYGEFISLYQYLRESLSINDFEIPRILKRLGLDQYGSESILSTLSLGEFIRLQFGILAHTINDIELIVLDEPGNFLDVFTQRTLANLLKNYKGALILITHDDSLAHAIGYTSEYSLG